MTKGKGEWGEPWKVSVHHTQDITDEWTTFVEINESYGGTLVLSTAIGEYHGEEVAMFERIAQCVNACAGMDDPAAEIAAKDAEIASLRAQLTPRLRPMKDAPEPTPEKES